MLNNNLIKFNPTQLIINNKEINLINIRKKNTYYEKIINLNKKYEIITQKDILLNNNIKK